MMETEQVKDRLRATAWQLASLNGRAEASEFLKNLARQIENAAWMKS